MFLPDADDEQVQARREPVIPLVDSPIGARLRRGATTLAAAGVLACWGLPIMVETTAGGDQGPVVRLAQHAVDAGWVRELVSWRPVAVGLVITAVVAVIVDRLAARQRRRIIGQLARGLKLRLTETVHARIIAGFRAPLSAKIWLPAGYTFTPDDLATASEAVSRAWGYMYQLDWRARRDLMRLRRAWKPGLAGLDPPAPTDPLHARLETIRPQIPQLDVQSVTPRDLDPETGRAREFVLSYTPKFQTAVGSLTDSLTRALQGMVAGSVPEGHTLDVSWKPEHDQAILRVAEALPTKVDHPVITDYTEFLGTDRLVLPFATSDYGRFLWWDVDHASTTPHAAVSGKTGAGKTTAFRALVAQGARRRIPWVLLDPKMKELVEFENYPGVIGLATDPHTIAETLNLLWKEKTERFREGKKQRLRDGDYPLLGIVVDELPLLQFQLQRLAKNDAAIKAIDPLGLLTIMFADSRGAGFRFLIGAQRMDAHLFDNSGLGRMNLGMRLAMQRQDSDGDRMMFERTHVTDTLDQTIRGRGVGTLPNGNPAPAQVWWTPELDRHPTAWARLTPEQRAHADALLPTHAPEPGLFLPNGEWHRVLPPAIPYDTPTPNDVEEPPRGHDTATPVETSEPDRDGATWDLGELDFTPAHTLTPETRFLASIDGALVPATLRDLTEDGDRVDLDVQFDHGETRDLTGWDRHELIPLLPCDH